MVSGLSPVAFRSYGCPVPDPRRTALTACVIEAPVAPLLGAQRLTVVSKKLTIELTPIIPRIVRAI